MQSFTSKKLLKTICSLLAVVCLFSSCSTAPKKDEFSDFINSSKKSRSLGHEDAAANDLKQAFDALAPKGKSGRVEQINLIYPEIIALSSELRQSGRFSLAKTMLDKAIQIQTECTLQDKKSAVLLKEETERVGELEISLIKRADKAKELRNELKELKQTTKGLAKLFGRGDFEQVARDGRRHLEILRKSRGAASNAYCDARRVVVESMLQQDNVTGAIKLLEDDIAELSNFTDQELHNADDAAVESAMYLAPLLGEIANLQVSIGKFDEAERNALRSLQLAGIMGGKANADSSGAHLALSIALKAKGNHKEALKVARKALPFFKRSKSNRLLRTRCLYTVAQLEDSNGLKKEAQRDYGRLVNEAERDPQPGASIVALASAAAFYRSEGDAGEYSRLKELAVRLAQKKGEPGSSIQVMYETLGDSSVRFSKFTEALGMYELALKNAPLSQKESLQKKIAMCKKNMSVTS